MTIHKEPHNLAGKTVKLNLKSKDDDRLKSGDDYRIEDYWDRVAGKSWMFCDGNPACMLYGIRSGLADNIPTDNEVVYGKVGGFGHLIHVSELGELVTTEGE